MAQGMKAIFVTMPLTLQSYVAEREQHRAQNRI
jgi:hypothetical protein